MTKEQFIENFQLLLVHLRDITEQYCFNDLSKNFQFILEPSERSFSDHLNDEEKDYLKLWNKLENTELSFDQVTELFYKNGKTPKWADCSVCLSTPDKTIVRIFFSRQFRTEEEIYYLDRGTGPFKALVEQTQRTNKSGC